MLWRDSHDSKSPAKLLRYTCHPHVLVSDHKPVSALFDMAVTTVDPVRQHKALLAAQQTVATMEPETEPEIALSASSLEFGTVEFKREVSQVLKLSNVGSVAACWAFHAAPNHPAGCVCASWLRLSKNSGLLMPGEDCDIKIIVHVDGRTADQLLCGRAFELNDLLLMDVRGKFQDEGKDQLLKVKAEYRPSFLGLSFSTLQSKTNSSRGVAQAWRAHADVPVFGSELKALVTRESSRVPLLLVACIARLTEEVETENIFNSTPDPSSVETARAIFDKGQVHEGLLAIQTMDIHTVASLLKLFLRDLPEPLCTYKAYAPLLKQAADPIALKAAVQELPEQPRNSLAHLMRFLFQVAELAPINLMKSSSLAGVMAPIILRHEHGAKDAAIAKRDAKLVTATVTALIEHSSAIFGEREAAVPCEMDHMLRYIEMHSGEQAQRIFNPAISTTEAETRAVQDYLDTHGTLDDGRGFSVHAVAELLVCWLESLPRPVLPASLLIQFVGCCDTETVAHALLMHMQWEDVHIFAHLMRFFRRLLDLKQSTPDQVGSPRSASIGLANSDDEDDDDRARSSDDDDEISVRACQDLSLCLLYSERGARGDRMLTAPTIAAMHHTSACLRTPCLLILTLALLALGSVQDDDPNRIASQVAVVLARAIIRFESIAGDDAGTPASTSVMPIAIKLVKRFVTGQFSTTVSSSRASSKAQGWLLKKNPRGVAWWKRRYFQLEGNQLSYCDKPGARTKAILDLSQFELEASDGVAIAYDKDFAFRLKCKSDRDLEYVLAADSKENFTTWVDALISSAPHPREHYEAELTRWLSSKDMDLYTHDVIIAFGSAGYSANAWLPVLNKMSEDEHARFFSSIKQVSSVTKSLSTPPTTSIEELSTMEQFAVDIEQATREADVKEVTPSTKLSSSSNEQMTAFTAEEDQDESVVVRFTEDGKLGIKFGSKSKKTSPVVKEITAGTLAANHPELRAGLVLSGVQETSVAGMAFAAAMDVLKQAAASRPLVLTFTVADSG